MVSRAAATLSQRYSRSTVARARRPISAETSRSARSGAIAATSRARSQAITVAPPPACSSRQMFTWSDTTTGRPAAMASTAAMPKFSLYDGSAKSRAAAKAESLSVPRSMPVKVTRSATPSRAAQAWHCDCMPSSGPAITRCSDGSLEASSAKAGTSRSAPS